MTCNAIAPGFFRTEINSDVDPQFRERVARRTPARRWGGARELAGPVVFLASEASSFVNGHMLVVDGGLTATLFETD